MMKPKQEKTLIALLCFLGISCVAYGMWKENNAIFLVGLVFVIAGYVMIRGKLKKNMQKKR